MPVKKKGPVSAPKEGKTTEVKPSKNVESKVVDSEVSNEQLDAKPVQDEVAEQDEISQQFVELMKKLHLLSTTFVSLKQDFKLLEKRYARELKQATKEKDKKRKTPSKPRAPSGFVKPTRISVDLAKFLGKDEGTEMARTEVTREINKYIRQYSLQDPSNGRKINPDPKLRKLLEVPQSEELTYFNLQKYLSKHFPKQQPVLVEK